MSSKARSSNIGLSLRTVALSFGVAKQVFDSYVEWRQLQRNRSSTKKDKGAVPAHLEGMVDEGTFVKAQKYNQDKRVFQLVSDWVNLLLNMWLVIQIDPKVWQWSTQTVMSSSRPAQIASPWEVVKISVVFLLVSNLISTAIALPWKLYKDFVIEERHGFNKKTAGVFVGDLVKGEAISAVLTFVLVFVLEKIRAVAGERFHIYLWVTVQVLIFVFMYIFPTVIQPLFNKFEPLKDESLKTEIDQLAKTHKFPLTKVFQVDGSKRSNHSNAYFYGFGSNKRIVLYDTLLTLSKDEILAVLCHEIGHWFHNHLLKNLSVVSTHLFVLFYCFNAFVMTGTNAQRLVSDFGVGGVVGSGSGCFVMTLLLFTKLYAPVEAVLELAMVWVSRKFEFQADAYAVRAGRSKHLIEALKKIQKDNLGEMDPDWLYSAVKYTHPPVFERVAAINKAVAEGKDDFVLVEKAKKQ